MIRLDIGGYMKDNKKIATTKKKASKETQAMAVRKAGDKGYTKGFEAGKLESADDIKELEALIRINYGKRSDERKVLSKAIKDANRDIRSWQFMTGITVVTVITMEVISVLG